MNSISSGKEESRAPRTLFTRGMTGFKVWFDRDKITFVSRLKYPINVDCLALALFRVAC